MQNMLQKRTASQEEEEIAENENDEIINNNTQSYKPKMHLSAEIVNNDKRMPPKQMNLVEAYISTIIGSFTLFVVVLDG